MIDSKVLVKYQISQRRHFKTLSIMCSLIFLCLLKGHGQTLLYEQYRVEEYGGSDQNWGLSQDSLGNIYVANSDGVLVFNGITWELERLPAGELVRKVAAGPQGRIYVGLLKDMGYLERDHHGKFQYHSLLPLLNESQRAQVREIVGLKVVGRKVFFNDLQHVYVLDDSGLKVFGEPNLGEPKLKNRYCILKDDGVYEYRNRGFTKSKLLAGFDIADIKFISDYTGNQIIVLTRQGELTRVTINSDSTTSTAPFSSELSRKIDLSNIGNVFGLRDGRIALLSEDRLTIIDEHGNVVQTLSKESTGYSFDTYFAFEDAFNNYWCANGESLLRVKLSSPLTVFDKNSGIHGAIRAMVKHNGTVYFGTSKGVYSQDSTKKIHPVIGTKGETVQFFESGKELYVLDEHGVMRIANGSAMRVLEHDWSTTITAIPGAKNYFLITASENGLWLVHAGTPHWTKVQLEDSNEQYYFGAADSLGNIWLTQYGSHLWRIRIDIEKKAITEKQLCDSSMGLPSSFNNRAQAISNGVVFSTESGIYRYNDHYARFEPNESYSGDLASRPIYSLAQQEDGTLFFFTTDPFDPSRRIAAMAKKGADGKYTTTHWPFRILSWTDPQAPIIIVSKHEVLFSNNVRVVDYDPMQSAIMPKPSVYISGVSANDSIRVSNITPNSHFRFPFDKNSLRISFIAPFFDGAEKVMYQYRIEGLDDKWTEWSNTRDALISNLREGDYSFVVRARNIYGRISEPERISIHIDPPFFRTMAAYLSYVLLMVCLVYGFIKLNTIRIERQKKRLQNEVARMTFELAATNEEILAQNEEMALINEEINKKNLAISAQAEELLQSNYTKDKIFSIVSHDLRGPVSQLNQILNMATVGHISSGELETFLPSLYEKSRDVSALVENILHWAKGQMTGLKTIPVDFKLAPIIRETISLFKTQLDKKEIEVLINVGEELQVHADKEITKLVVRNFLANAVKFTHEKGKITVSATCDDLFAKISVADDGVGLSADDVAKLLNNESFSTKGTRGEHGTGIGLMMCKEFIAKNGGTSSIDSTPGKGSVFSFTLPVIHDLIHKAAEVKGVHL